MDEKLVESVKIMREELIQIQSRHRQFYRVQLVKGSLDKFQPGDIIKKEKKGENKAKKEERSPEEQLNVFDLRVDKRLFLKNFAATLLLYKDR